MAEIIPIEPDLVIQNREVSQQMCNTSNNLVLLVKILKKCF